MLSELFGMEWWKVHDEAERLEHAVSTDFEAKLLAKLGSGGACPHGNLSELEAQPAAAAEVWSACDAQIDNTYTVSGFTSATAACSSFWNTGASVQERSCGSWSATTTKPDPLHRLRHRFSRPPRLSESGLPRCFSPER